MLIQFLLDVAIKNITAVTIGNKNVAGKQCTSTRT